MVRKAPPHGDARAGGPGCIYHIRIKAIIGKGKTRIIVCQTFTLTVGDPHRSGTRRPPTCTELCTSATVGHAPLIRGGWDGPPRRGDTREIVHGVRIQSVGASVRPQAVS
jgi:hypothetical protein